MGGNILLHVATMQPNRIEAMVVVSATMYFPEQARAIMRQVPTPENQPQDGWAAMRKSHKLGDQQIAALWNWTREMNDSYDDMNFTPPSLSRIKGRTLIVYGDRDPLYPVEMAIYMYRAIPGSALWGVPNRGYGPVFSQDAAQFISGSFVLLSDCLTASSNVLFLSRQLASRRTQDHARHFAPPSRNVFPLFALAR